MNQPPSQSKRAERLAVLQQHLVPGDLLTHTRCMGCLEEHVFVGFSGEWLCGTPTRDSLRLGASTSPADDISPLNVTHVNRVPVDALGFLANTVRYSEAKRIPKA